MKHLGNNVYVNSIINTAIIIAVFGILIYLNACASVHQARSVTTSGFLKDYSHLQSGASGQAKLVSFNPGMDFKKYKAIILDPIQIYPSTESSSLAKLSPEDQQNLLNYFDATIRKQLQDRFQFVQTPGPGVMRFRIALTEAKASNVPLDVVSSVIPMGIAVSGLSRVAFGRGTGVGLAGVEFEALDSQSNERLSAAVDAQIGRKYTGRFTKFSKWNAARAAFDHWAKQLSNRLDEMQKTIPIAKQPEIQY